MVMSEPIATLDVTVPDRPRLVVEVPPELQTAIQEALDALQEQGDGSAVQRIVADALRAAMEQRYFWTPEWQAGERAAEEAIAEGRVRTFDSMERMLGFLDAQ
jgi:predicted transcriptional regulator